MSDAEKTMSYEEKELKDLKKVLQANPGKSRFLEELCLIGKNNGQEMGKCQGRGPTPLGLSFEIQKQKSNVPKAIAVGPMTDLDRAEMFVLMDYIFEKSLPSPPPKSYCRGLVNLGKTCYLNCIMQVLVHVPMIKVFFSENRKEISLKQKKSKLSLLPVFDSVLQEFGTRESTPIYKSASTLLVVVWEKIPSMACDREHDAHEFFISLINLMQKELLEFLKSKIGPRETLVDQLFLGSLQSEVICSQCGKTRYKDEAISDVALEVIDAPSKSISLNELLTHYTRIEQLGEHNLLDCTWCSEKTMSTKQLKFNKLPHLLCIQLKRFQHNPRSRHSDSNGFSKIKSKVVIPERLDFTPFMCSARRSEAKKQRLDSTSISTTAKEAHQNWYRLYAIVNHTGAYDSGHYRTFLRRSSFWFLCDDEMVTRVSEDKALKSEGYLLFYENTFSAMV